MVQEKHKTKNRKSETAHWVRTRQETENKIQEKIQNMIKDILINYEIGQDKIKTNE